MHLESPAFAHGGTIPPRYTGEGRDISPPLQWDDPEGEARAFALLVEDPDAPTDEPFVHWIAYDIPGDARALPEALPPAVRLEQFGGLKQGRNSFDSATVGYRGPFPPVGHGTHHYHFHLYALRRPLGMEGKIDKRQLLTALQRAQVVDEAELVGTYERGRRWMS